MKAMSPVGHRMTCPTHPPKCDPNLDAQFCVDVFVEFTPHRTQPTIFSPLRACYMYSLFVILPCFITPYIYVCCHGNLVLFLKYSTLSKIQHPNIKYAYTPVCLYTSTPLYASNFLHLYSTPLCLYVSMSLHLYLYLP